MCVITGSVYKLTWPLIGPCVHLKIYTDLWSVDIQIRLYYLTIICFNVIIVVEPMSHLAHPRFEVLNANNNPSQSKAPMDLPLEPLISVVLGIGPQFGSALIGLVYKIN